MGAVVIGFDEHFSYPKILKAATYLSDPDCHFIATCADECLPVKKDMGINNVFPGMKIIIIIKLIKNIFFFSTNYYLKIFILIRFRSFCKLFRSSVWKKGIYFRKTE